MMIFFYLKPNEFMDMIFTLKLFSLKYIGSNELNCKEFFCCMFSKSVNKVDTHAFMSGKGCIVSLNI